MQFITKRNKSTFESFVVTVHKACCANFVLGQSPTSLIVRDRRCQLHPACSHYLVIGTQQLLPELLTGSHGLISDFSMGHAAVLAPSRCVKAKLPAILVELLIFRIQALLKMIDTLLKIINPLLLAI